MSYLDPPRLHFAGTFQAAPSTVNNNPLAYDTATFDPADRVRGWNPRGDAVWRLIVCRVTEAIGADGTPAAADDPIRTMAVTDSDRAVAAKLVDLDPQQQLVSMIFGLEVRLVTAGGSTLLRGRFQPGPFADIWDRAPGSGGDIGAGAMYQSVLTDLEWDDDGLAVSPFLAELRATPAAGDGRLSIKFNVDGYNLDIRSPDFTRGRVTGTIGPAGDAEPDHFVRGRQFMATVAPQSGFFTPAGRINFCVASVDEQRGKVVVDLGNALPAATAGGPMADLGDITVACRLPPPPGQQQPAMLTVGEVPAATYTAANWLETAAGVFELPADRALTADELEAVSNNELLILLTDEQGQPALGIAEAPGGVYARADQFVFRLDAGDVARARLYATVLGRPYAGARIITVFDPSQLQSAPGFPDVATPIDGIDYPARVVTGKHGMAELPVRARYPGNPRGFLDGQVYALRPMLEETINPPAGPYPFNQWTFISLLVWDAFAPDDPPTWHGSIRAIFQQYFNLYPVMDRMLDLSSYESVCERSDILRLAFGLDEDDPNTMPVTRDLSTPKRQAILRWLTEVGADGKPLEGVAPPMAAAAPGPARAPAPPPEGIPRGGKADALDRRLAARSRP